MSSETFDSPCDAPDAKKTVEEKAEEADAEILAAIASRRKLASDLELAKGVQYTDPVKSTCVLALTFITFIFKPSDQMATSTLHT